MKAKNTKKVTPSKTKQTKKLPAMKMGGKKKC